MSNEEKNENQSRESTLPATTSSLDHEQGTENIRRCCEILGVDQENLTADVVKKGWKKQLVDQRDTIGRSDNHDLVAEINNAKDTLLKWLRQANP